MAVRMVTPDPRTIVRPPSPVLSSVTEGSLQGLVSASIEPQTMGSVFHDLLTRFQSLKATTLRVSDWYKHAWKDMSEELRAVIETETKNPSADHRIIDLSSEGKIRGSVFEGMFASVKKSVIGAESLIHNYCFKRRGKYTEKECKQGVGMALERMANDIWRQVALHVQKPIPARASEVLSNLSALQQDSEALIGKLRESQSQFEEVLKRHLSVSTLSYENTIPQSEDEIPSRSDRSGSEVSASSLNQSHTSPQRDYNSELREQSNRLITSFQKFATTQAKDTSSTSTRKEMDSILRDMLLMVKTSRVEASRVKEELAAQKVERQINRIRNRVDALCKGLEEASVKSSAIYVESLPSPPLASGTDEEIVRLKETLVRQSVEIEKLKEASIVSAHAMAASPDSSIYRDDFEKLNENQSAIIADLRNMRELMGKITTPRLDVPKSERPPSRDERTEDFGTTLMLKALRASASHIDVESDSEFIQKYIDEVTDTRKGLMAIINAVNAQGYEMTRAEEVAQEFVKIREEYLRLKDEHDELMLKFIRIQSETEINASYQESRIQALEAQLEEALKAAATPPRAEPSLPSQPPPARPLPSTPQVDSTLEEEIAYLSSENFVLLSKIDEIAKQRELLLEKVAELQRSLHQTEAQLDSAHRSPMPEEEPPIAEVAEGAEPPRDYASLHHGEGKPEASE